MIHIKYNPNDLRYIFLTGDLNEIRTIQGHFNKVPQYMFLPSFQGVPKPEVFVYESKLKNGKPIHFAFSGLWKHIVDFCTSKNIQVDGIDDFFKYTGFRLTLEQFTEYIANWNLNITPRDYQIRAAWLILKYRQSCSQLATRSGKTLVSYLVFRYLLESGTAKKILMIVPSVQLVKQGVGDFKEYAEFFRSGTVWADGETAASDNLTIGTFQSLIRRCDKKSKKYDPQFYNGYDVILVDEAHTSKCQSIKNILAQPFLKGVKLKFGFSGSLPEENTIDNFAVHSLLGPKIQDIRSKELMNDGYITPIDITQIRINYPMNKELHDLYVKCGEYLCGNDVNENGEVVKLEKKEFTMTNKKTLPYAVREVKNLYDEDEYREYLIELCKANGANLLVLEQMLVHRSERRIELLDKLVREFKKNCIVFAHHTEYITFVYKHLKETFPNRNVYKITGTTTIKARDKIIKALVEDKDAILVASYGCLSTGITLRNLDYGIMFQSFKSQIINKQSLGRGLCLAPGKEKFYLYDVIDCFPTGRLEAQGKAKAKLYESEGFEYKIEKI